MAVRLGSAVGAVGGQAERRPAWDAGSRHRPVRARQAGTVDIAVAARAPSRIATDAGGAEAVEAHLLPVHDEDRDVVGCATIVCRGDERATEAVERVLRLPELRGQLFVIHDP